MSEPTPAETALAWLRRQLADLSELRNATIRDSGFKLWRQNTLTVIQRIWPGVTERSRRFRRIPFSPASSLAGARETRESFERGCAEAGDLLLLWIQDIEGHGVRHEPIVEGPASETMADFATTVNLDGDTAPATATAPAPESEVPLLDLPEVQPKRRRTARKPKRWTEAVSAGPVAASQPEPTPIPQDPPMVAGNGRTKRRTAPKSKMRLKDMLGLGHLSAAQGGIDHSKLPEVSEAPEPQVEPPAVEPNPPADVEPFIEVMQVPPARVEIAPNPTLILAPLNLEPEPVAAVEPDPVALDPTDLLQVVSVEPARVATPEAVVSLVPDTLGPGAFGPQTAPIAALAGELDFLEMSAADRVALRRFLLDLALRLETNSCAWVDLRAAIATLMEYPALARKALPALMPFLDRAA